MAKAQSKASSKKQENAYADRLHHWMREAVLLLSAALTIFLLMALFSYSPADPGWSDLGSGAAVENLGGRVGAWFADVLLSLFGLMGFVFPWLLFYAGWMVYRGGRDESLRGAMLGIRSGALVLVLVAGCSLLGLALEGLTSSLPQAYGGALGGVMASMLKSIFNATGAAWLLCALFVVALSVGIGFSWLGLVDKLGDLTLRCYAWLEYRIGLYMDTRRERQKAKPVPINVPEAPKAEKKRKSRREPSLENRSAQLTLPMEEEAAEVPAFKPGKDSPLPSLDLLDPPRAGGRAYSQEELQNMSRQLEQTLADFGVTITVVAVEPGPVITRFELDPAPGVKVSQISNLAKDIARALSTISVRVVEVIPGKSYIGLEIPNQERELVALREIFENSDYSNASSALTLALGKDISGNPVVADLARMPHLLVAGTTGSGKSVAINVMILSLLFRTTPEQVRLIMIDPKMLELSVYEGIPHLLAPVVTDMKEAANALRWSVAEMERRYKLMAAVGVRNLAGFNRKVQEAIDKGEPIVDPLAETPEEMLDHYEPPTLEALPHLVVIVDELADLMMVVGKKVEELIARIAQKARAAGIHLILATQRPSVDVITGLIKANIPTRIAFQVASRVDSRTILDQIGAESLLGHGDMLFLPPGTALPRRVHGAFVDDHEVHKVAAWLKQVGEPDYHDEILAGTSDGDGGGVPGLESDAEADPLYDEAVQIVTESRKASISWVQRRLRVGYNRAARLVEQMEAAGVVGPLESNGAREVLAPPPPEV